MLIPPPDPALDQNPVRALRRYMRETLGAFVLSPGDEAQLYELEEWCDDQILAGATVVLFPRWDLGGPT